MNFDKVVLSSDPAEHEEWLSLQPDYWTLPQTLTSQPANEPVLQVSSPLLVDDEFEDSQPLPQPVDISTPPDVSRSISASSQTPSPSRTINETRSRLPVPSTSRVTLESSLSQEESMPIRPSKSAISIPESQPEVSVTENHKSDAAGASVQEQMYQRSFRQRKPGQLNPYSIEQARYQAVLQKQDWEDAVVPLKRTHEYTAEELARKKEAAKKRGADDLDGWLVLEDGVRVRKEDWHEGMAAIVSTSKKRHRRHHSTSDAEVRLQRALQGYTSDSSQASSFDEDPSDSSSSSDDDDDDDPRDIPKERSTPKRRQRPFPRVRRRSRAQSHPREKSSTSTKRAAQSVIEVQDSEGSSPPPPTRRTTTTNGHSTHRTLVQPRATIRLDDTESSEQEQEQEQEALSSEHEKEMRAVKEDRFALKGRKKRYLKGMMPAVFMRKAEKDLELMRKEQRAGRHVDYAGSGDEEDVVVTERKGEARRRRTFFEDGDGRLKFIADDDSPDEEGYAEDSWLAALAPKHKQPPRAAFGPLPEQTNRQKQTRDMIDRLLVQSRAAQEEQRHRRKRRSKKQSAFKATKDSARQSFTESRQQYSLADEDELWDAPVFLAPALATASTQHISQPQIPQPHAQRKKDSSKKEDATWRTFRKFSHDFQIERLDPRAFPALPLDSMLVQGQVDELIAFLRDGVKSPMRTVFPFGIPLHEGVDEEAVEAVLPRLTDAIIEAASVWCNATTEERSSNPRPAQEACDALRYLSLYASSLASPQLLHLIQSQLDALDRRLRSTAEDKDDQQQAAFNYYLVPVHWACLELTLRLRVAAQAHNIELSLFGSPASRTQRLIKALLRHGPNATGRAIKSNAPDVSVEAWAALINLALSAPNNAQSFSIDCPNIGSVWEHLFTELDNRTASNSTHPVMASEALCYAAMLLCALSQISSTGHVTPEPRLKAHWPVLARCLEPVTVADLAELDRWSSVELHRRDGYLWSLFARTLIMVDRWNWVLTEKDGILPKLYDILNARQLDNLAIDSGAKDFPAFLQHFDGRVGTTLEGREDSAFHIFLKLLVNVAQGIMSAPNEVDARRTLNRFLMRVSPMRKLPPNSSRAMLVNHFSLFITLTIVAPWSTSQRLSQVRALLSFDAADQDTRPVLIRAMMYFALVYHHQKQPLDPILVWFASAAELLRADYSESDKKRSHLNAPSAKPAKGMSIVTNQAEKARERKALTTRLYNCALALTLLLRAIQNILSTVSVDGEIVSFPDARFLNSAWTSTILASSVALDPLVGTEILKCLRTYLDLRGQAVDRFKRAEASQDDFGFDDFDFNDPALNDLIGFEGAPPLAPTTDPSSATTAERVQEQDAELAKLLKNEISPALFRLITSIFTPSVASADSAPKIHQGDFKSDHIADLIHCWATCASVMVQHKLKAWTSYFRFGDEACSRISDASARRETSMLLANAIASIDPPAFSSLFDEVVRVWFETVVDPAPSKHQIILTDHVMDTFSSTHVLFHNIAGLHLDESQLSETDAVQTFVLSRPQLLKEVFRNMAQLLRGYAPGDLTLTGQQQLFTLVGQMMTAMRNYLHAFGPLQSQEKRGYEKFCAEIVLSLSTITGSQINERTVPALKHLSSLDVGQI